MRARFKKLELGPDALGGVDVLDCLTAEMRSRVSGLCQGRLYPARTEIVLHRDTTQDVFFLLDGSVQITVYSTAGRVITFDELGPGEMFGEMAAIDEAPRVASVVTTAETTVACLPAARFHELIAEHPPIALAVLERLSGLVRLLCGQVFEFHALPVPQRIRAELLRLAARSPTDGTRAVICPLPTHAKIASRVATNREAVTREVNLLIRRGLLKRTDDGLVVENMEQLRGEVADSLASD